jgi:hypothetical protein
MSYPYQNPQGYPPPSYPPRKSNTVLLVVLTVVAVAAVAGLVVVFVMRGSDDSKASGDQTSGQGSLPGGNNTGSGSGTGDGDVTGSSKVLGQKVADVIQNHDVDEAKKLVCKPDSKFLRSLDSLKGTEVKVTVKGVTESGDTAEVAITMVRQSDSKPVDQKINIKQVSGKWCIN